MGLLGRSRHLDVPSAGELASIEALDRQGLLVTTEGALVRYLRVGAKNPLVMADDERAQVATAFGDLCSRVPSGQSVQFYVEARPVELDRLLATNRAEAEHAIGALEESGDDHQRERAEAFRRLRAAHEESLHKHADALAAVELAYYVVIPLTPDQRTRVDWRSLAPQRRRLKTAALRRALESHRRVARESLRLVDAIRGDLEALDLSTHLLDGPEVADLLWRRFNPTTADRTPERRPGVRESRLELVGELEAVADAQEAAAAAHALRDTLGASMHDFDDPRHSAHDADLEHTVYVATPPDATYFGWMMEAMRVRRPFALSVYVHALDRLQERARHKARHRRIFGVNRGAEIRGRVADYEMLAQEEEAAELVKELTGQQRSAVYEVSIYTSVREPGPGASPVQLAEAVEQVSRDITTASDARVNNGQLRQPELWLASLPLGRDVAAKTRKYVTRNVGDTIPLVGTSCGSPNGVPWAFTDPGRTVEYINPFDPAHDTGLMVSNCKSGAGKTFSVIVLLARMIALGLRAFVIDRAGHYEFLCHLIPGAHHLSIGSSADEHAVNPWDTPDPAHVPIEKVAFLVGLHALLVGDQRPDDESYGLNPLERNLLESAIRAVYARAAIDGIEPRESHLRDELQRRAVDETAAGADSIASILRSLAERLASYCGDGSYAYLLDRPTTIRHDSPLVVFDTQKVPSELVGAVLFVLVEHVTTKIEQQARSRLYATGLGLFEGRYALVIDEAWRLVQRRATGDWVNDLARRCRHLGLFLIAMSQQLSDFAGPYGKALLRNATQLLFLRQALDELEYIRDAVHLSDAEVATIARLKTVKGAYAQAYWINGTRGGAMVTFFVAATEYWLATSEPHRDVPLRAQALRDADGNAWRALEALAELDLAAAA